MTHLADYPPQVWNPHLGRRILVRWYVENDGHHVIVSEDMAGAVATLKAVVDNHGPTVKIRSIYEADLVPCPRLLAEDWAKHQYETELDEFKRDLRNMIAQAEIPLPEGFLSCNHRGHSSARYECKKCEGSNIQFTLDPVAMFNNPQVREPYRKTRTKRKCPAGTVTEETVASLKVAVLNGGHHHPGVVFHDVHDQYHSSQGWESLKEAIGFENPVLFFFVIHQELQSPELLAVPQAAMKKWEDEQKARKERFSKQENVHVKKARIDFHNIMEAYKGTANARQDV